MIAYVDSSVVLRLVLGQPGRLNEWPRVDAAVASGLVEVECFRTLDRFRLQRPAADRDLADRREAVFALLRSFEIVDVDRPVLARAALSLPIALGTLDAIHLATAVLWRESQGQDLVMATHDVALATAARASGFTVIGSR